MFCSDWIVYIEYTFGRRAEETKQVFFEFRKTRHFVEKWHQCVPNLDGIRKESFCKPLSTWSKLAKYCYWTVREGISNRRELLSHVGHGKYQNFCAKGLKSCNRSYLIRKSQYHWFLRSARVCILSMKISIGPNFTKIWSCSNVHVWPTNRRRILRWFQKCILFYTYLADFSSYGRLKAKKARFWEKGPFSALKWP